MGRRGHHDPPNVAETDEASFGRQVAVSLKGKFNTLREAAKRLRDGGRIINFSSSVVSQWKSK